MPFKTILVHLDSETAAAGLTEAAIELARKFSAYLIGLHVIPRVYVPAVVHGEMLDGLVTAQRQAAEAAAKRMAAGFEQATSKAGVAAEWRRAEALFEAAEGLVLHHARAADLVVLGQPDPATTILESLAATEEVMFGAGRPVLIIPNRWKATTIGERVLLGWNDSRESARAVFDALPFLQKAHIVHVLTAGPVRDPGLEDTKDPPSPVAEIAATLERHGIACGVTTLSEAPADMAGALMTTAEQHGCDLMVMGGYGRSRLREFIFGGATRGMLKQMTIPVLMSH